MKAIFALITMFIIITGCDAKQNTAKSVVRDNERVNHLWQSGAMVQSKKQIIGEWVSEDNNLPQNSPYTSYYLGFGKDGSAIASMTYKTGEALPAPPLFYEVTNSRLCTGVDEDVVEKDKGEEIRISGALLLIKNPNEQEITVFRRAKPSP